MNTQLYIGIMSGTSMDGADAVLIRMQGNQWQGALAHAFTPYSDDLRQELLNLQNISDNELHGTMDYRLRMYQYLDFICRNAKEPLSFYYFKALIHQ